VDKESDHVNEEENSGDFRNSLPVYVEMNEEEKSFYEKIRDRVKKMVEDIHPNLSAYSKYILLFPDIFMLLIRLLQDKRIEARYKVIITATVGYLLSPVDIIPDFFGGLGFVDDIALSAFVLNKLLREIPQDIILENWYGEDSLIETIKNLTDWVNKVLPKSTIEKIFTKVEEYFLNKS
jgi:uncharacterized membrane protein YkvA (DUF1232 family)